MMANQRRRADPSTSSRARSAAGLAANAASRMPSSGMHSAMERLRAAVVACEQASAPRAALPAKALRCERRRTAAFVSALGDAQLLHDEARSEQLNMLKKAAGEVRPASRCSARTFTEMFQRATHSDHLVPPPAALVIAAARVHGCCRDRAAHAENHGGGGQGAGADAGGRRRHADATCAMDESPAAAAGGQGGAGGGADAGKVANTAGEHQSEHVQGPAHQGRCNFSQQSAHVDRGALGGAVRCRSWDALLKRGAEASRARREGG